LETKEVRYFSNSLCLFVFIFVFISVLMGFSAEAAEKNWSGAGDGALWSDDDNWSPAVAPTGADDVLIDIEGASAACDQTFAAKSVTLGGRETAALTIQDFVYGDIAPATGSTTAFLNRSGGTFRLQGAAGTVTLSGGYKDSEETLVSEPSFMFWVE
jgi:hypothetical protein